MRRLTIPALAAIGVLTMTACGDDADPAEREPTEEVTDDMSGDMSDDMSDDMSGDDMTDEG
jgi:hypothetical protein